MYSALKDQSDWSDIKWDSILQIVNYLNVFNRHMNIQIPNNLSLNDFVEYIISLTTTKTIDPSLNTNESNGIDDNVTSEAMEIDEEDHIGVLEKSTDAEVLLRNTAINSFRYLDKLGAHNTKLSRKCFRRNDPNSNGRN